MKLKLSLQIFCGLLALASLASADTLFVANFGVNTITKYDADGNGSPFTSEFVNGPNGVALDSGGNLYVTTNDNVIEVFAPDGTDLGVFASTGVNNAMGLAFDRSGNLYAANFGTNTVEQFAPDGTDLGVFANVIGPTGLAFDPSGNLCVAVSGNTIARFAPNGIPLSSFSSLDLNNPAGLAFDSLGNLYVANSAGNSITMTDATTLAGILSAGGFTARDSWSGTTFIVPDCAALQWRWWNGRINRKVDFGGWQGLGQDLTGSCDRSDRGSVPMENIPTAYLAAAARRS
jgi:sugar lactone lactonase YvrE